MTRSASFNFLGYGLKLLLRYNIQSEKMKRHHFILIGTLFLLLAVCEKKNGTSKKFFRFMEKSSDRTILFQINNNSGCANFAGEINFSDNGLEFILMQERQVFYCLRFHSVQTFSVDGSFCISPGNRKIERSSFDWVFALILIVFALRGGLGKPYFSLLNINRNV